MQSSSEHVIARSAATWCPERSEEMPLGCNLPVQCFDTAVHFDGWYQEIAPKGIPFGPTSGASPSPESFQASIRTGSGRKKPDVFSVFSNFFTS